MSTRAGLSKTLFVIFLNFFYQTAKKIRASRQGRLCPGGGVRLAPNARLWQVAVLKTFLSTVTKRSSKINIFVNTFAKPYAIAIVRCWAVQSTVIVQSPIEMSKDENIHEAQVARNQQGQTEPSSVYNVQIDKSVETIHEANVASKVSRIYPQATKSTKSFKVQCL